MPIPDFRTANNPNFTVRESNEILQYLKRLIYAEGINSTKYGTQLLNFERDPRYITLRVSQNIPPYSIILAEVISGITDQFYQPIARADGFLATEIKNVVKDLDKHRYIYCTNDSNALIFSSSSSSSGSSGSSGSSNSSSSSTGILQCFILGEHRPHLIRTFNDGISYKIGDRVDIKLDGSGRVQHSTTGPFTCVSIGDTVRELVWIVKHSHQLSYIPWVRTTTSTTHPVYPTNGNTFVVERGIYVFDDTSPGLKTKTFTAAVPAEKYIAICPCGWLPNGTIRRMTLDHNQYYLIDDCCQASSSSA